MQLKDAIQKRKSIREFSSKKPDWRKIIHAIDYARFAPMAGNFQTIKFILIDDKEKIKQIQAACQQDFVGQAEYIVAAVSNYDYLKKMYPDFAEIYGRQQAGAAIENFLLAIVELGMATCWVGWFDEAEIKRVLSIPENCVLEAIFPIGFESKIPQARVKKALLENMLYFNKYGNKNKEARAKVSIEGA
jgi:nitroreductase